MKFDINDAVMDKNDRVIFAHKSGQIQLLDGAKKVLHKAHDKACLSIKIVENADSLFVYSAGLDMKLIISKLANNQFEVVKSLQLEVGTPKVLSMDFYDDVFLLGHEWG